MCRRRAMTKPDHTVQGFLVDRRTQPPWPTLPMLPIRRGLAISTMHEHAPGQGTSQRIASSIGMFFHRGWKISAYIHGGIHYVHRVDVREITPARLDSGTLRVDIGYIRGHWYPLLPNWAKRIPICCGRKRRLLTYTLSTCIYTCMDTVWIVEEHP